MEMDFIPIDYDYFDFEGRNYAKIIGRNSKGKRVCVIDSCEVYFWAILKNNLKKSKIDSLIKKVEKIQLDTKGRKTKVEKVELKNKKFLGKKVKALKIFATNYKDMHNIADKLGDKRIVKRRGYDLGYIPHYLMEKKILPLRKYKIKGEILNNSQKYGGIDNSLEVDFCLELEKVSEIKKDKFQPKALAYDIETDGLEIGSGEILMVSLVGDNFKKVITWKKTTEKKPSYVEYVKDEADLLEKFVEEVKSFSPDFLVGYNSDGFDLPYLKSRADKNNVRLSLGLDGSLPKFSRGRNLSGKISGIVHIDLLRFIRTAYSQYMKSETLSLNEVSKEFLGNKKKEFKIEHSSKLDNKRWLDYYEYNLHDSVLAFDLFEKFWPDLLEFSRIISEPPFEISRNGMSSNVETFILNNLENFDEIPEKRPGRDLVLERRNKGKYEGAFVYEPTPGMYKNIVMFDFTSSYASVIVSYNLSRSTFVPNPKERKNEEYFEININNETLHFEKKEGFVPKLLREIIEKRKKYKKELKTNPNNAIKRARSNAFKLLANSYYGYQGFFGARYYCREAAAATAAFAKKSIKEVMEKIREKGYDTVYGDTDSIALLQGKRSKKEIMNLLKNLNSELPGIMELESEGFFERGLWVTKRTGKIGAKKKYALINKKGELKIRGFETVRRDWCNLAREVQNKVIEYVLKDGNEERALKYVKEVISRLKNREIPLEKLIIRTQLKKPLSEYVANTPHVVAGRRMEEKEKPISSGNLVEYYIAEVNKSSKLVRDRVRLPDEKGDYNIKYYLSRQLLPAVENIFQVFGIKIEEIIEGKRQTNLGDFEK